MLMMEEGNYNDTGGLFTSGDPAADADFDDFDSDGLCIDLDTFNRILEEDDPNPPQSNQYDPSCRNMSQGDSAPESIQFQSGLQFSENLSFQDPLRGNSDTSDARTGPVDGSLDYHGKLEISAQNCSPVQASSASFKEWYSSCQGTSYTERVGMSLLEMPSCSTASSFAEMDGNQVLDHGDNLNFDLVDDKTGMEFKNAAEEFNYNDAMHSSAAENINPIYDHYGGSRANTLETPEASENRVARSMEFLSFGAAMSSHNVSSIESTICHGSDVVSDVSDPCSIRPGCMNGDDAYFTDSSSQFLPSSSNLIFEDSMEGEVVEVPMTDFFDLNRQCFEHGDNGHVSRACGNLSYANDGLSDEKTLVHPYYPSQPWLYNDKQTCVVNEDNTSCNIFSHSAAPIDKPDWGKLMRRRAVEEGFKLSSDISPPTSNLEFTVKGNEAHHYHQDFNLNVGSHSSFGGGHMNLTSSDQYFPSSYPITSTKMQLGRFGDEKENKLITPRSLSLSKVSPESTHSNSSDCRSHVDNDPDICILEDISQPARLNQSLVLAKKTSISPNTTYSNPLHNSGVGGVKSKGKDERFIFRVALQGLSQPLSEATPPDGVLTVPLLRHQRIALSWMTQKEKVNSHCLGGILADDQGLGKTVSTIALILNERAPSSRASQDKEKVEPEMLTLDDDDDDDGDVKVKQESDSNEVMSNGTSKESSSPSGQAKGRPAAGTLIVCPTSVLRQWAEELHNKVTSKANLSVLVYHGSNRTKDPYEIAKYDVVLTTYSIVSMEVPKQPCVDRDDDDEKGKLAGDNALSMDFPLSKKRKCPPSSNKKGSKHKKKVDESLLDSASRPLAKVAWFRVVLDEAQSIKNHRTQVARACWGLRAKRRWCLSGTPIQNAIDDLYSYFRFLKYEPFSAYKIFCSSIKFPITKNPAKGYPKLQAILQTMMLRRTKGTLLDGKPIINLPPKVIEMKRVEFTKEERDFYSRLESDSRAQFKEYANAGTVKQNYVNILLMLLRLRQACDHPLLVSGFDSNSLWKSSIETAKKLPQEKITFLLNCLASLALCGICNDPPEDAVVTVCGHVFCNQCISQHLSGDDNQCPATNNCKVRISASSVFSSAALTSTLSGQPIQESSHDCPDSQVDEVLGPRFEDGCHGSSKIKAALEVLKSLAKPQDHRLKSSGCPEGSSDVHSGDIPNGSPDEKIMVTGESLNDSSKVLGEKAIVFSQWTRMLDLFEVGLKRSSIQYRRLDGTMSVAARDKAVKDFKTLPEVSVMIMSLKAASLGLNMVEACHVLLLDLWWNPTTEDQAVDRAHRIGQTRQVTVSRLTVKDTVEDRILALQQKKREMVASAFGEDETGDRQTRLTVQDLEYLFMA